MALLALALWSIVLAMALHLGWITSTGGSAQQLPLVIETGTAAVIAATTGSPFGEPERATGRWLPYLRLVTVVALTGAAFGALSAGSAASVLPGGELGLLRNVIGLVGIGLLFSVALGGALGWIGPTVYLVVAEYALSAAWRTPWTWPARPSQDIGAAVSAMAVYAIGIAVMTTRGARESSRDSSAG